MGVYPISIRTRPKFLMSSMALWWDFVMYFFNEIHGTAIHNWLSTIHDFSACDVAKTLNSKSCRGPRADSFLWVWCRGYNSSYSSIGYTWEPRTQTWNKKWTFLTMTSSIEKTILINPTMHPYHNPQCTIFRAEMGWGGVLYNGWPCSCGC